MDIPGIENTPANNSDNALLYHSGYDYEFVTPLDNKYECSICLLGLRTPVQTPCGHRFCYDCIMSSMNRCGELCPIDKNPLNESQLFRDHCVEREILHLKVRCTNYKLGCKAQIDLQYVDDHLYACTYKIIMCPNECPAMVLQRELEDHMNLHCRNRLTQCQHCSQTYSFLDEQHHLMNCSKVGVPCDLCQSIVQREELANHKNDVCPHAEISCSFLEHGCQYKATRDCLKKHMEDSIDVHLQLLSSAYKRMKIMVTEIVRSIPFSRQPSFRSQYSTTSIPERSPTQSDQTLEGSLEGAIGQNYSMNFNGKIDWDIDEEVRESQLNVLTEQNSKNVKKMGEKDLKSPRKNSEALLRDLSDKSIDLDQKFLEERIKFENLSRKINFLETNMQQNIHESFGRICNGYFIWKIPHFTHMCELLQGGKVLHSPPFYSSAFGYKFCIRTNVYKTHSEEYLTLYIHMMQGDYDDILDWPFKGKIVLSLLDCSDSLVKRHISEILEITTKLQAFVKPQLHKSARGYGFKEFIPLIQLFKPKEGTFIKNDAVYIKATVEPAPQTF